MLAVDPDLLALARGPVDGEGAEGPAAEDDVAAPVDDEDPFGGLIPVCDVSPFSVPKLRMGAAELAQLPIDPRAGFFITHVDGVRTVAELVDISHMSGDDIVEVIEGLFALGAIDVA